MADSIGENIDEIASVIFHNPRNFWNDLYIFNVCLKSFVNNFSAFASVVRVGVGKEITGNGWITVLYLHGYPTITSYIITTKKKPTPQLFPLQVLPLPAYCERRW